MIDLLEYCSAFFRERQVEAYLVGGALRDELLGRDSHDLDIAVMRDALPLARVLADRLRGAYFPMDVERDTARVLVPGGDRLDVALVRGGSIQADLAARDFTINAMARRVDMPGEILDPHQGMRDLAKRVVRVVSPDALDNDPARLVRAVRLAATLALTIEPHTCALIRNKAHFVRSVSSERVRDELVRILELPHSGDALRALEDFGLLSLIAPGADVSTGTLTRLQQREQFCAPPAGADDAQKVLVEELNGMLTGGRTRLVLFKLAALYDNATDIAQDAERLHFSRHEVEYGEALVRHRDQLAASPRDELGAFRFFRQTGAAGISLLAAGLAQGEYEDVARYYAGLHRSDYGRVIAPRPLVPGSEIAVLAGAHGAAIGRLVTALLEAQVSGAVRTREEALVFVAARADTDESKRA